MLAVWLTCVPLLAAPGAAPQDDAPAWLARDASAWPRLFAEVDIDLSLDNLTVDVARGALVRFGGQVFGLVSTDSLEFATERPDDWPDGPWIPLYFQREAWRAMHFRASTHEREDWTARHRVAVAPFLEGLTLDAVGFDPLPASEPPVPILEGTLERPTKGSPVIVCGPDYVDANTFIVARGKLITQRAPNWVYDSFFVELDETMAANDEGWLPLTYGLVLDERGRVIGSLRDTSFDVQSAEDPALARWFAGPDGTWKRLAVDGLEHWLGRPADLVPGRSQWLDDQQGATLLRGPAGALFARGQRVHAFGEDEWLERPLPAGERQADLVQPLADGAWLGLAGDRLRCVERGGAVRFELTLEGRGGVDFGTVAVAGDSAAFIDGDGHVQLVDLRAGGFGPEFADATHVAVVALGPGRFAAATSRGALRVIESGAVVAEHGVRAEPGPLGPLAATRDGRLAVGLTGEATVVVLDAATGERSAQVPPFGIGSFEPIALTFGGDGSWLATLGVRSGNADGTVAGAELAVWDIAARPATLRGQWVQFDAAPADLARLDDDRLAVLLESGELREFRLPLPLAVE